MPKAWVYSLKLLTTLALFIGFSFLIIEQRLESKTYELKIRSLQGALADIQLKKRELLVQIDAETKRLSSFDADTAGSPVSMKDIILVPIRPRSSDPEQTAPGTDDPIRDLLARIPSDLPFFNK